MSQQKEFANFSSWPLRARTAQQEPAVNIQAPEETQKKSPHDIAMEHMSKMSGEELNTESEGMVVESVRGERMQLAEKIPKESSG